MPPGRRRQKRESVVPAEQRWTFGECDAASVVLQSGRQRAGPLPSAAAGHTKHLVTDPSGGMTTLHWAACVWERRADTPSVFLLPRPGIPAVLSSLAQPACVGVETNAATHTKRQDRRVWRWPPDQDIWVWGSRPEQDIMYERKMTRKQRKNTSFQSFNKTTLFHQVKINDL